MSRRVSLFLIPILHQTTTLKRLLCGLLSCSSFQFYIKPQPITASSLFIPVVPHSNSTSNHNFHLQFRGKLFVVPHSNSTSNHNVLRRFRSFLLVVPHSNSTSNHNMVARLWKLTALFLIPILHQTTTQRRIWLPDRCCSSFQFYIKPQLTILWFPTWPRCSSFQFYIKPQLFPALNRLRYQLFLIPILHQTTTRRGNACVPRELFLIPILHQTTTISVSSATYLGLFLIPILHQTTTISSTQILRVLLFLIPILHQTTTSRMAVIHILHVTHMTPMHKTSCRTPGKLVGCNFVFQRAIYQKNSSC